MGADYTARTGCGLFMVESHTCFLKEVRAPADLDFEGMVLGTDAKRNWLGIVMKVDGIERAAVEYVELHVDMATGRTTTKPENVQAAMASSQLLDLPAWVGRGLTLERRKV